MVSNRIDLSEALWTKSSYSNGDGGNCVEVADGIPGLVPVRDSKAPDRPALILTAHAWAPFITALKDADRAPSRP
ncbi:DUF397 domain-containing protein [Streptomyces sp. NPDC057363]|uniref:DUF397 domain-containing protein n=1 Tax=Streptomyces sp. NPDC057363 TaxID=3346107 RepID=UPI0036455CB9